MQMSGQVTETNASETVDLHTCATGSDCHGQQLPNGDDPLETMFGARPIEYYLK